MVLVKPARAPIWLAPGRLSPLIVLPVSDGALIVPPPPSETPLAVEMTLMAPPIAWAIGSKLLKLLYGP